MSYPEFYFRLLYNMGIICTKTFSEFDHLYTYDFRHFHSDRSIWNLTLTSKFVEYDLLIPHIKEIIEKRIEDYDL